jgi:dihydroflavonol-4-reductase
MIRRFLKGRIPVMIPGGFDYVDVRDVAGAVLAAADRGRSGEAYIVSGTYISVPDLFKLLERVSGRQGPRTTLPLWLARTLAEFSELYAAVTRSSVVFTRGSVDILQTDARIDSSKAAEELGFRARTIEETVSDTLSWIIDDTAVNPDPLFV